MASWQVALMASWQVAPMASWQVALAASCPGGELPTHPKVGKLVYFFVRLGRSALVVCEPTSRLVKYKKKNSKELSLPKSLRGTGSGGGQEQWQQQPVLVG